jgi:nicotinamidase-related amidase
MPHPDPTRRTFLAASSGLPLVGAALVGARADEPNPDATEVDLAYRFRAPGAITLHARRRKETAPGKVEPVHETLAWNAAETAVIVCDMWDKHWCAGATRRVGVLVPKMNAALDAARSLGVFIVHAPSDTIAFYDGTPPRRRMQQAPTAEPPVPIARWCTLDETAEGKLPIDDRDGGCDCHPTCKNFKAWSRQHPGLDVAREDGVSDSGVEIYNTFRQQGITNVVLMGVHTNMCVLGRSFGIRSLTRLGLNVALARDLTDTMYNPRSAPHVSHAAGTRLVVEHVERHWCPTFASADLLHAASA